MKNTTEVCTQFQFEVGDMVVANKISRTIRWDFSNGLLESLHKNCYSECSMVADPVRDFNKLLIIMRVIHKDIAWRNDLSHRDDSRDYRDDNDNDDNGEEDNDEFDDIDPNDVNEKCHCYITYDVITGEEFICMEPELDKM